MWNMREKKRRDKNDTKVFDLSNCKNGVAVNSYRKIEGGEGLVPGDG
jgi:hypothetical protein